MTEETYNDYQSWNRLESYSEVPITAPTDPVGSRAGDSTRDVSDALGQRLLDLGALPRKISVLRNGEDLEVLRPLDRPSLKMELGMSGRTLLSVGNPVELKAHDIAIDPLMDMPETELVIVGAVPIGEQLESRGRRGRVSDRVPPEDSMPHRVW